MHFLSISSRLAVAAFVLVLRTCSHEGHPGPRDGATYDAGPSDDSGQDASAPSSCSLFPQKGCGPDQRCGLSDDRRPICVPIGTQSTYERCDPEAEVDPCGAGLWCLRDPDMGGIPHRCTRFCAGAGTQGTCAEWESCIARADLPTPICSTRTTCRLLVQDCGDDGSGQSTHCYLVETIGAVCLPDSPAPKAVGDECELANDCVVGSSCLSVPGTGKSRCLVNCDPDTDVNACAIGERCVQAGPAGVCRGT